MRKPFLPAFVAWFILTSLALAGPRSFKIEFDPALQAEPYSGRVYVVITSGGIGGEPRVRMGDWFNPPQVCAVDAKDVAKGGTVTIDETSLHFPGAIGEMAAEKYTVQAVARRNLDAAMAGKGAGDLYSEPAEVDWTEGSAAGPVTLKLTKTVAARPMRETDRIKVVEFESKLLSAFHKRPVKVRAGVVLPKDWSAEADRTWPAVWSIPGFGGDHTSVRVFARGRGAAGEDNPRDQIIWVVPDPTNYWGHSVFADSANTGPWGRMLIEEMIPEVEKRFKGPASPGGGGAAQRFVTGVSSGGWSSLWLMITYPDQFAACYSHVPDPVDFRDFQKIDLYTPGTNMYKDAKGEARPLSRPMGPRDPLMYEKFVAMETVLGPGGQIASFEAVFSPRGADGLPRPLFDRKTGAIDPVTAKAWEPYDIRLVLEKNWAKLGPRLKDKIHVYAGEVDTFYLEGAARLLKASLEKLDPTGGYGEVIIVPGMPHGLHGPGMEAMVKRAAETVAEPEGAGK